MSDLAASDVGRSNRIYSEDEILAIQSAMRDSEQLLEEHCRLIARYKIALAPHRILPRDVLRCIFALNAQEAIYVPFQKYNGKPVLPAAVILTHVCSLWRHIALSSPELWNNVRVLLEIYNHDCGNFLPYALELLSRACDLPINLKLTMTFRCHNLPGDRYFDFHDTVYQLISHRIIQKFRLELGMRGRPEISPQDMFSIGTFDCIRDLELTFFDDSLSLLSGFRESSFPNLEAFFYHTTCTSKTRKLPHIPWSGLRRLDLSCSKGDVPTTLGLLPQCTMIEECALAVVISGSTIVPKVTLHNLRDLQLGFIHVLKKDSNILDTFFSLLSFPNLQSLTILRSELGRGRLTGSQILFGLPSLPVLSPLARNLKVMAPQLRVLCLRLPTDGKTCSLFEHMPSLRITRSRF
jgi:hypothetical protein